MAVRKDEQLAQLNAELVSMGELVEAAISNATRALIDQDEASARAVIAADTQIDDKERHIESLCLKLLLIQQPVARDLRKVSTALKMITDLERIGDQAADICELCEYLVGQPPLRELEHIHQLAATTTMMVTESINAFVNRDMQLAQWVIERDDAVDALFVQAKHDLIALVRSDAASGERAFDLLQVAKYYERIGDHAENIAEWVIFYITGKHKDWQVL